MFTSRKMREYAGWLLMLLIGLYFLTQSFQYGLGSMRRIGAGAFPMLSAGALTLICVLMLVRTASQIDLQDRQVDWHLRPFVAVMAALLAFGLSIRTLGLIPAIVIAMAIAASGHKEMRILSLGAVTACVAFACWLLFSVALRQPLPAFTFRGF